MTLPTEKSQPTLRLETAKALLYGPPKIGKSTFAAEIDPDHTLFLACEPGLGALEVFSIDVRDWKQFREVGGELAIDPKHYKIAVVDTADELYRMCADHICSEMGIKHPADAEYGKGWAAVADEFRLRVGKLANLGLGVWFISHAKDQEVKKKVGTKTVTSPTLSGQARQFLTGFCDFIFLATWEGDEETDKRVLRTQGAEEHEAGGRMPKGAGPLTDPLPLDAGALRKDIARAMAGQTESEKTPPAEAVPKRGSSRKAEPAPA
jgi:AAA domain